MPDPAVQSRGLVQPLPPGPVDVVADVHGEIGELRRLVELLGYDDDGRHAEGRVLVLLGDLVDRGPDSPAVVDAVRRMMECGGARCVLGNHELNILRDRPKGHNAWFFGQEPVRAGVASLPAERRAEVLAFFRSLPLALEREDLRVVHACWDDAAVQRARAADDTLALHAACSRAIHARLRERPAVDEVQRILDLQNDNAVNVLTSGPEKRAAAVFFAGGRERNEARARWWDDYRGPFCVFGHYWRVRVPQRDDGEPLFAGVPLLAALGPAPGTCACIDYSVGGLAYERRAGLPVGGYALAALRWPEREVCFSNGRRGPMLAAADPDD